jgi:hypothetical protein
MKTNDEFDNILDDALAEYRDAEPLSGLESRVLRRVQEQPSRRRAWWGWSLAAGLAMALLAVAAWFELRDPPYRPLPTYQASTEQAAAQPSHNLRTEKDLIADLEKVRRDYSETFPADTLKQKRRASSKSTPVLAVSSRGEQFPAPAPLTSEERALLALAHSDPEALRTLPGNNKELAIAPITIQPLTDGSGGNEGDN